MATAGQKYVPDDMDAAEVAAAAEEGEGVNEEGASEEDAAAAAAAELAGEDLPGEEEGPSPEEVAAAEAAEIDTEARRMGWRPKEEFRGNPADWRDAAAFVQRGKEIAPIVRQQMQSQLDKSEAARAKLGDDVASMKQQLARQGRVNEIALKRQREQLLSEGEARKRAAAEYADVDEFDKAAAEQREQLEEFDKATAEATTEPEPAANGATKISPEVQAEAEKWVGQNKWFGEGGNRPMTLRAMAKVAELEEDSPGMEFPEMLQKAKEELMEEHPAFFSGEKPAARKTPAPRVAGGAKTPALGGAGQKTNLARTLPPEAKTAGEDFIAQGLYKNLEEYAKDYFAEDNA